MTDLGGDSAFNPVPIGPVVVDGAAFTSSGFGGIAVAGVELSVFGAGVVAGVREVPGLFPEVDDLDALGVRDVFFAPEPAAGRVAVSLPTTEGDGGSGVLDLPVPIGFAVSTFACVEPTSGEAWLAPAALFDSREGGAATRGASISVAFFPGRDPDPGAF